MAPTIGGKDGANAPPEALAGRRGFDRVRARLYGSGPPTCGRAAFEGAKSMRGRVGRMLAAAAVAAAALAAVPARAQDCSPAGAAGFEPWLASFKQVALRDGISPAAFEIGARRDDLQSIGRRARSRRRPARQQFRALRGRARHARHRVARALRACALRRTLAAIEQRFGVPGAVLVAIWGLETSFGGDSGSYPTFSRARHARLGLPPGRPLSRRADRRADAGRARRLAPSEGAARRLGRRDRPDPAHALGDHDLCDDAGRVGNAGPDPQFRRRARLDRSLPRRPRLAEGRGLNEGEANFDAILQWNASPVYAKTIALFADKLAGR